MSQRNLILIGVFNGAAMVYRYLKRNIRNPEIKKKSIMENLIGVSVSNVN
jgi:hypothetical protein